MNEMQKIIIISAVLLLIIITLLIIISNIFRTRSENQPNQQSFPTSIPHSVSSFSNQKSNTNTNVIQKSNDSTSSNATKNNQINSSASSGSTTTNQTSSRVRSSDPSQQNSSTLYTPSDPYLISQKDADTISQLANITPLLNDSFSIEYSPILDKYIVTTKGEKGEEVFIAWATENGVLDTLQNPNNAIISKATITEIHSQLPPHLQPTQPPQQDRNETTSQKQISLLMNLFNGFFSLPETEYSGFDFEIPSITPAISISPPYLSGIPSPTFPQLPITPTVYPIYSGEISGNLFPNPLPPVSAKALKFKSNVNPCIANKDMYDQASAITKIPWYVLAAIHYNEASCRREGSLVSGRKIGENEPDIVRSGGCSSGKTGPGIPTPITGGGCKFNTLTDSAIYAGNHLKGKIGKVPETFEEVVKAFSRYNGGGNRNCDRTPYSYCPKEFYGEDDPYPMNFFDIKHETMYLVYCADLTPCNPPRIYPRPGALTIMRLITNQL